MTTIDPTAGHLHNIDMVANERSTSRLDAHVLHEAANYFEALAAAKREQLSQFTESMTAARQMHETEKKRADSAESRLAELHGALEWMWSEQRGHVTIGARGHYVLPLSAKGESVAAALLSAHAEFIEAQRKAGV